MRMIKGLAALALGLLLSSCGGGGGDAGSSTFGSGGGASAGGGTGTGTTSATEVNIGLAVLNSAGASVNSLSSVETGVVRATLSNSAGAPVPGIVVTFGETAGSLLKFSPSTKTALTNSQGQAQIEISANDPTIIGATLITVQAAGVTVGTVQSKAIEISSGGSSPVVPTPNAINFIQVVPASSSIVIKGAGGAGRSESANLTFKVVDGSNTPIKGAKVNFTVNPANSVTLNTTSADSNSDGLVTTTVSSGAIPTAVVVTATSATNASATTQSDTLVVSNGVVLPAGFELVAKKYNLDGTLTGDNTDITAFVRDEFGNPVPQGVAVSFVTDYGAVGTATSGGCTTNNAGQCTVPFSVQDPRGRGLATITGTIKKGNGSEINRSIFINMSASTGGYVATLASGGIPASVTTSAVTCKANIDLLLADAEGRAPAAGTLISSTGPSTLVVKIIDGTPVLDQRGSGFPAAPFSIELDTTGLGCKTTLANLNPQTAFMTLKYTTPGGSVFAQRVVVNYAIP